MSDVENNPRGRLIIVSNRLPIRVLPQADGSWRAKSGTGGLVTALAPILRDRGGVWIGWPGIAEEDAPEDLREGLKRTSTELGYRIDPVLLTRQEEREFYAGFSNEIIWPIFHDLQTLCNFDPRYWDAYQNVNRKFAEAIAEEWGTGDYVWIHDYHLMTVARELRRLEIPGKIGFFLHIPFPPLDIFLKIPWRLELLQALLDYDLVGFQTERDRRNYVQCVRALVPGVLYKGRGRVVAARLGGREIRTGSFPISIDAAGFAEAADTREVAEAAWYIHENLPKRKIILGIDRLDYTKGIPYRLDAYRDALIRYPELHGKISLVQVVVPSRTGVPEYQELQSEIEQLVGAINGQFTRSGWVPIHYIFRTLDRTELLGYYRACEIALITPLKDGMNLIAKEYCASQTHNDGVLILSEFAGAASQLQTGAILVNPYHIRQVANAIYTAFKMEEYERKSRMRRLRQAVRRQDVFWWVDSVLKAAISKDLEDFPVLEEYMPRVRAASFLKE
ncbi:MAG: trehalose-6-phosphate synthase [Acidobacteriota bacterium]